MYIFFRIGLLVNVAFGKVVAFPAVSTRKPYNSCADYTKILQIMKKRIKEIDKNYRRCYN